MSEFLAEKVPINGTDSLGLTALHWAASGRHDEACEWLVQQGANVNAQAKDGDTPLFKAAWRGHPSTCSVLIAQGADRRILNKEGKGAYDLAKTPAIKRVCTPLPELGILKFYFYFCCMFACSLSSSLFWFVRVSTIYFSFLFSNIVCYFSS